MAFKRRNRFDRRIKNKKKIDLMYLFLFVAIVGLGIGYATYSTGLNISGNSKVNAASWDVHFDDLDVTAGSVATEDPAEIVDDTTVEFGVKLTDPNDFYEFTVKVVNDGSIDAMVDALVLSPSLTPTQENYIGYTVTYEDDTLIEPDQELKAGTFETIKVRFEYLDVYDKTIYPEADELYNISVSLDYKQADENAVPVPHPGEAIYRWSTTGWTPNQNISSFTEGTDYVRDKTQLTNMNAQASKYFLKYYVGDNVISEKFVCFVVSEAMAQANAGMYEGEYCLMGNEPELFEDNAQIIYDAFGSNCSTNPYETSPSVGFNCSVSGLSANAYANGRVDAGDGNNYCYVNNDGNSTCYLGS